MIMAKSYATAYQLRASLTHLCLSSNRDVACINIMCSRVTLGCACRLAQVLENITISSSSLKVIELSNNKLPVLPASLWTCKSVERIDASNNLLEDLGLRSNIAESNNDDAIIMSVLEEVDLRNNINLTYKAIAPLLLDSKRFPKLSRILLTRETWQNIAIAYESNKVILC
jgi:hypothetical protein